MAYKSAFSASIPAARASGDGERSSLADVFGCAPAGGGRARLIRNE